MLGHWKAQKLFHVPNWFFSNIVMLVDIKQYPWSIMPFSDLIKQFWILNIIKFCTFGLFLRKTHLSSDLTKQSELLFRDLLLTRRATSPSLILTSCSSPSSENTSCSSKSSSGSLTEKIFPSNPAPGLSDSTSEPADCLWSWREIIRWPFDPLVTWSLLYSSLSSLQLPLTDPFVPFATPFFVPFSLFFRNRTLFLRFTEDPLLPPTKAGFCLWLIVRLHLEEFSSSAFPFSSIQLPSLFKLHTITLSRLYNDITALSLVKI